MQNIHVDLEDEIEYDPADDEDSEDFDSIGSGESDESDEDDDDESDEDDYPADEVEGDARQRGVSSYGLPPPLAPGGQQGGRPGPPPNISRYGLPDIADIARHVISCHSTQDTRVHNACR